MTRRTVSLPFELERTVRLLQARLLTTLDRDVSFTQALNVALAASFGVPELGSWVDRGRWRELLADGGADDTGALAEMADLVFEAMEEIGPWKFWMQTTMSCIRSSSR